MPESGKKISGDRLKVCSIFGTRPEAVKMGPVVLELQQRHEIDHMLVVTGQHRSMLDQMLRIFGLTPDYDLDIMTQRQTLSDVTVRVLQGMEKIFEKERPDIVLVHGDTSTSFVSSLAAYYAQIAVGHVEAGLRTGDKYNPFPEEMNRHLIDTICDVFLAPTVESRERLELENKKENIFVTGNTVIDALLSVAQRPAPEGLLDIVPDGAPMVLVETHRRENLGEPMRQTCLGLRDLVEKYPALHVVFPVHLNPAVRDVVFDVLDGLDRVLLKEPSEYIEFVHLMKRARFIVTDSGGVQEEAPSLGSPVLVLRNVTERPEAVAAGTALLTGPNRARIVEHGSMLMDDETTYQKMATASNPYGDGLASKRIADALLFYFGLQSQRPPDFSV